MAAATTAFVALGAVQALRVQGRTDRPTAPATWAFSMALKAAGAVNGGVRCRPPSAIPSGRAAERSPRSALPGSSPFAEWAPLTDEAALASDGVLQGLAASKMAFVLLMGLAGVVVILSFDAPDGHWRQTLGSVLSWVGLLALADSLLWLFLQAAVEPGAR